MLNASDVAWRNPSRRAVATTERAGLAGRPESRSLLLEVASVNALAGFEGHRLEKSRQCSRRRQNSTSLSARLLPTHRRSASRAHAGTIEDESRSETCSTKPSVTPVLTAFERVLAAASPTRQGTFKYRNRFRSR